MRRTPLPDPRGHWTPARKRRVLEALAAGVLARPDALARYDLSADELDGWFDRFTRFGVRGLSVKRLQVVGR